VSSRGSTTFLLDEVEPSNSVLQFFVSVVAEEPEVVHNQVCFDTHDDENGDEWDLCIEWSHFADAGQLHNAVYACGDYMENGACDASVIKGTVASYKFREENDAGIYVENQSHTHGERPEQFTYFEVSHAPDSETYEYTFRIPVSDLPDQSAL
jgi:hypothetical protein